LSKNSPPATVHGGSFAGRVSASSKSAGGIYCAGAVDHCLLFFLLAISKWVMIE